MSKKYSVYMAPPEDFAPTIEAAGCYCEHENKILFLKRAEGRSEAKTWCIPGGKIEKGEGPREAVIREVSEEIGVEIDGNEIEAMGRLYVRLPNSDYIFHVFRTRFLVIPHITLAQDEHEEARWLRYEEILGLPLIMGGKEALNHHKQFVASKSVHGNGLD